MRLILIVTLPAVLAVGIHGALREGEDTRELRAEERRALTAQVAATRLELDRALRTMPLERLGLTVKQIVDREIGVERIRVFDPSFQAILSAGVEGVEGGATPALLQHVAETGVREEWRATVGNHAAVVSLMPLRSAGTRRVGFLEVTQSTEPVDRRIAAARADFWIRLGLMVFALVSVTGLVLQRQVLRPLTDLMRGIERLEHGWSAPPLPEGRQDELGAVARAFNHMAQSLDASRRQLHEESERSLELERQLRRAQTLAVVGRLASGLAHEVGTPLNVISGRAEFVLRHLTESDPHRDDLVAIVAQIDRISRTLRSLLDTVRPQAPHMGPESIADVIDTIMPLLRHAARRRGIALVAEVPATISPVFGDRSQLQQVIINLVFNALEATAGGGRVVVRAREAGDDIALEVIDTGSGMAPELLPRVFEAFFTTKRPGEGTGLGLAIARDIVKRHGGDITVESSLGEGSTFTVRLRRAEALAA